MSGAVRIQLDANEWDREPSAEELANAPVLSQTELTSIMKSQEYRSSKLVQKLVAASLSKGMAPGGSQGFAGEEPEMQTGDEIAAKQATMRALFADPRYRTDAAYRYEVAQKIKAFTQNDNGEVSNEDIGKTNQTVSVGLSTSPYHGADLRIKRFARYETPVNLTGPDAPVKTVSKPSPEDVANS